MVTAQNLKPQIQDGDGAIRAGGRGHGRGVGPRRGQVDLFNSMFAQKPMQLKDGKCDGCGLDAHKGDCVKKANQQRARDEMAPAMQSLARKLEKADNNAEERNKILKKFGNKNEGRLVLTRGRGRGGARGGGRGAASAHSKRSYSISRGWRRQSGYGECGSKGDTDVTRGPQDMQG